LDPRFSRIAEQGHHDVWPRLEQVDRLDEALDDVHHEVAIGRDQLAGGCK
jgi:hypothetical protein